MRAAQESNLLDDYYVSTEDEEITCIAQSYGAKVLARPVDLALDDSTMLQVLQHVLKQVPCQSIVALQPTSPLPGDNTVDDCILEY
jgi:N-acylneuraminate cytidylyltransferase